MTRGEKGEGGDGGFCPGLSGPDLLLLTMQSELGLVFYDKKRKVNFSIFVLLMILGTNFCHR